MSAAAAVRTTCPYCGVGCGIRARVADGVATITGDPAHPANFGKLCSKGMALAETLDLDGRLLEPTIAGRRAAWDEALDLVAARFERILAESGPESIAFYVSGQLLTEDYYVANKLMKGFIGSANIDTNSRLCMASSVAGYKRAFGADFVPNSYTDIEAAELLVLVGSNTAWCHPILFQRARLAKERNPRLEVVVIDPRRTATCDIADVHLAIKPGTDVALFNGLLAFLDRAGALDDAFLAAHTEGFEEALATARASAPSAAAVASTCGLPESAVETFFERFARTPRTVTLFSQGVNQSTSGTDKVNAIINAHLATGRIGRPGTGPFSLTGQPNAMGGREVGGLANQLAAHRDFAARDVDAVARFWRAPNIAREPGLKAVDLFAAIGRGEVRAVWIASTNPVVSMPDADAVRRALADCEFVVVSDCMRETDTTALADVLLPAAAWGEKSGTVTNSERRISRQRAFLPAPGSARPDWWIFAEVGKRMGFGDAFAYAGPADIFREHARLSAFENDGTRAFDIGALGALDARAYDALEPVQWPAPASAREAAASRLARGEFFTPSRKARFVATEPRPIAAHPTAARPYLLLTGRVRDHWHTMTRTGKSPRLAQTRVEPFVAIHPEDALELGLANGGFARIAGASGTMQARVEVTTDVRRGEVFAPMHWNDQFARSARVGTLIEAAVDPESGQPELKASPVTIERAVPTWRGFALSRERCALPDCEYRVLAKGAGFWRYELAGFSDPAVWSQAARSSLGGAGEWVELADAATGHFRAARLANGRLEACLFVSRRGALPDRQWLASLFAGDLGDAARRSLLTARPDAGAAPAGPVVCACFAVGRDALVAAIRTRGIGDVRAIGKALKAGTNCGSCIPELNALIAEHAGEVVA